ncbi:MAG: hypothetical protein ACTSQ8_27165 [Candidatus Helarchaeota archaeon]
MKILEYLRKYSFLIAGILIIISLVLAVLTPAILSFNLNSQWIRLTRLFDYIRIDTQTGAVEFITFLMAIENTWSGGVIIIPPFQVLVILTIIFTIIGGALLIISTFTTSKELVTKILRITGIVLCCYGEVLLMSILSFLSAAPVPIHLNFYDFMSANNSIPLASFWIWVIGIALGIAGLTLINQEDVN